MFILGRQVYRDTEVTDTEVRVMAKRCGREKKAEAMSEGFTFAGFSSRKGRPRSSSGSIPAPGTWDTKMNRTKIHASWRLHASRGVRE